MVIDTSEKQPQPYWSRGRVLLAGVIVIAGLGPIIAAAAYTWHASGRPDPRQAEGAGFTRAGQKRNAGPLSQFNTENLLISVKHILSGGPRKDGIPAPDEPETVPVSQADFMAPADRVIGITINGASRAYPINILNWHECVNDVVGGVPVAVIYCPLCDSVSVVDRRLNGRTYEFGISGLLLNSNVLLYDRTDDALWSQVGVMTISGPHAGKALHHLGDWRVTRFEPWGRDHPDSTIVTTDTGYFRDYGRNSYEAYQNGDKLMFPLVSRDDRLPDKTPIVGIKLGKMTRAYPVSRVIDSPDGRLLDTIGGGTVELVAEGGRDSVRVAAAPDDAKVVYTFWFAWAAFHTDTQVYMPPAGTTDRAAAASPAADRAR